MIDANYLDIRRNFDCFNACDQRKYFIPPAEEPLKSTRRKLKCGLFYTIAVRCSVNFVEMVDVIYVKYFRTLFRAAFDCWSFFL